MIGIGYRREMADWDMSAIGADFFEVAPENWVRRDRDRLHEITAGGKPLFFHGVSLNLGGTSPLNDGFLQDVRALMDELGVTHYSDHLAASGDAHQLYDLFPIALTRAEARRVSDRIAQAQDILGRRMAVENTTWYANVGEMSDAEFIGLVCEWADCDLLLDLNNARVNHKNHGTDDLDDFVAAINPKRVRYMHVAGHEFDERFGLYIDTHSQPVEAHTQAKARQLQAAHGWPILLEWDNDVPDLATFQREIACLTPSTAMCAA